MMVQGWANVVDVGPTLNHYWLNALNLLRIPRPRLSRCIEPIFFKCLASVADVVCIDPALAHMWCACQKICLLNISPAVDQLCRCWSRLSLTSSWRPSLVQLSPTCSRACVRSAPAHLARTNDGISVVFSYNPRVRRRFNLLTILFLAQNIHKIIIKKNTPCQPLAMEK